MPEISLTDFVDFVVKSGTPKLTKVRQLKERGDYDPAADFWRTLREGIISFQQAGGNDKRQLDRIRDGLTDRKKIARYPLAIKGYKRFLGRKQITWFDPPRQSWESGELTVRVNPELGLVINSTRYAIKLYFKDDKLEKRKVAVVLAMMEEALRANLQPSDQLAILDVSSSKFFPSSGSQASIAPLLAGEAASFVAIWNNI